MGKPSIDCRPGPGQNGPVHVLLSVCAHYGLQKMGEAQIALLIFKLHKLALATPCESKFPKIGHGDAL